MNLHPEFQAPFIQVISMRRHFFRVLNLVNLMKDKNSSRDILHCRPLPGTNTVPARAVAENSPAAPSSLHLVQRQSPAAPRYAIVESAELITRPKRHRSTPQDQSAGDAHVLH
jgi:hypothetical protein